MLSAYLVRMIEHHAEDLTREVLADLCTNPKVPSFHNLSGDELHRRVFDLYHNLGHWLDNKSEENVEAVYTTLGRNRFLERVPLAEVICAHMLVKEHLRNFVRRSGVVYSALELHREVELNLMIGHFFDKAVYYLVKGYEDARTASLERAPAQSAKHH